MKLRKIASMFLVTALCITSAMGCSSGKEDEKSEEKTDSKQGVEITFATFNQWYDDGLKAVIAKYEEETGNKVKLEISPDDQFRDLILSKVAIGDVPDVIAIQPRTIDFPSLEENAVPLEGEWIENVSPTTAKFMYRDSDNAVVTAPYGSCSVIGMIYNKEIFEKAGIELPLESFQELEAACEKIQSLGITPICMPNKDTWTSQIITATSFNELFKDNTDVVEKISKNEMKFGDVEGVRQVFERLYSLTSYANEDLASTTYQMAEQRVADGEAAMMPGGDWLYADFEKDYPDAVENLGMMPVTVTDDNLIVNIGCSSRGLWVMENAKQKEAAIDFVNKMMSEEYTKVYYEKSPGISPIQNYDVNMSSFDAELKEYAEKYPVEEQFTSQYFETVQLGTVAKIAQKILLGEDIDKCLDEYYSDYVKANKALRVEGF